MVIKNLFIIANRVPLNWNEFALNFLILLQMLMEHLSVESLILLVNRFDAKFPEATELSFRSITRRLKMES